MIRRMERYPLGLWRYKMNAVGKFLLACTLTFALSGASVIATPVREIGVYGDWIVRCVDRKDPRPCDMVQFVPQHNSRERAIWISIAYSTEKNAYSAQIRMPLGINFSRGVVIGFDDRPPLSEFTFTGCEARDCYVKRMMTPNDMEPLQSGNMASLVAIGSDGHPMVIPLSFKGFDEALVVMTERNINGPEFPNPGRKCGGLHHEDCQSAHRYSDRIIAAVLQVNHAALRQDA